MSEGYLDCYVVLLPTVDRCISPISGLNDSLATLAIVLLAFALELRSMTLTRVLYILTAISLVYAILQLPAIGAGRVPYSIILIYIDRPVQLRRVGCRRHGLQPNRLMPFMALR